MIALLADNHGQGGAGVCRYYVRADGNARLARQPSKGPLNGIFDTYIRCPRPRKRGAK